MLPAYSDLANEIVGNPITFMCMCVHLLEGVGNEMSGRVES